MLVIIMAFCLIVMLTVWNNWIFTESDGFGPATRPSCIQFYWLAAINILRLITIRKSYSFSEYYPHLFPITNNR